MQGYFGGWVDLLFQRFIEVWTAIPSLYLLLILSSVLVPGFFVLLGILLLFSWVSLVGLVRAEFLRGRNFEYIQAARALGVSNAVIMFRHLLPNAMVATMTFLPFIVSSSVMTLTALDFLGFGLPPGSPSLGELLAQGKANVQAPWLGFTGFFSVAIMLSLLIFIGEARARRLRSAQDVPVEPCMDAINQPLLDVRDLSVAFHQRRQHDSRSIASRSTIKRGECVALVGESGSGKSVSALSVLKLLPYPTASHPSGSIRFKRPRAADACANARCASIRGNDISIIFQEPMTSLNPLHTIEAQIGEILAAASAASAAQKARARTLELLTQVGIPDPETRLDELSASIVRRPAPARHDRDGARQRAGSADRGRADHRARRHRAGADPGAARRHPRAARHEPAVHHPRSRHRPPHRRRRLRHEQRQDRRAGAGRGSLHRAEASLYARAARRRAEARSGAAAAG